MWNNVVTDISTLTYIHKHKVYKRGIELLFHPPQYREPLPTVFSMLHPLDEIAPVVCKPAGMRHWSSQNEILWTYFIFFLNLCVFFFPGLFEGRVQYVSDSAMKIVFTCCQPSIVVSYDTVQGIHSVWTLRKVTHDVSDHEYTQRH